jgi:hypothetical protein
MKRKKLNSTSKALWALIKAWIGLLIFAIFGIIITVLIFTKIGGLLLIGISCLVFLVIEIFAVIWFAKRINTLYIEYLKFKRKPIKIDILEVRKFPYTTPLN